MVGLRRRQRSDRRFRHTGTLSNPPGFDVLISVGMGPDGPVGLWAAAADQSDLWGRHVGAGGASFAETRTSSRPRVPLTAYSTAPLALTTVAVVPELPVAHPFVQPLPGGRFLVVGARCAWREEGPESNALVVGDDGSIEHAGTLGDGIEHVLVDSGGDIWVGYFDEGIFGNYGWGGPGPQPLGAAGIVRWSGRFEKRWEYQPVDHYHGLADCYTLNVGPDRVLACPYVDFPVVQIHRDRVSVHPTTKVSGPRGLVAAGDTIGLIGSYADAASLRTGSLRDGLSRLDKSRLGLPDGAQAASRALICRGSIAHLFVGAEWFTFDLADA